MKPAKAQAEVAVPGRRPSLHADRPVFVAEHGWRERGVRAVLGLAAALLLVWLLALIAGALGLGGLPPLPALRGGDSGSTSTSKPAPPPASAAPDRGPRPASSYAAAQSEGRSDSAPTGRGANVSDDAPATEDAPASAIANNPGIGSHPGGKGAPAGSGGGDEAIADSPASQQAGGNGNTDTTTVSGAGEAPSQPATAQAPPALTPSGNEVPSGSAGGPSAKAEATEESPGGAHRTIESGHPG